MKHLKGTRSSSVSYPPGSIFAADLNLVTVQAACDACADGGTVVLPAGDVTWAATTDPTVIANLGRENSLSIWNKSIRLIGAGYTGGGAKTIIRHDGVGSESTTGHRLIHVYTSTASFGEITGIDFRGTQDYVFSWGSAIYVYAEAVSKSFRIHHNSFDMFFSFLGVTIGPGFPLWDHNIITGLGGGILVHGKGIGTNDEWMEAQNLGTSDWVFIEDNQFNFTDATANSTKRPCDDLTDGGRICFRHNTVTNGFFQTHDKSRNTTGGGAHWDVNNNTFTCSDPSVPQWKAIDIASGTGVCWNNAISGDFYYPIAVLDTRSDMSTTPNGGQTHCNGSGGSVDQNAGLHGYICEMQVGSLYTPGTSVTGSNLISAPAYFWGNTFPSGTLYGVGSYYPGGVVGPLVAITYNDGSGFTNEHIQKGRDFIENGSAKPGYTGYTYPHPLQATGFTWP